MVNSWTFLTVIRKESLSSRKDSMRLKFKADASEGILMHTSAPLTLLKTDMVTSAENFKGFRSIYVLKGLSFTVQTLTVRVIEAYEIFIGTKYGQMSPFVYDWSSNIIKMFLPLSCIIWPLHRKNSF